MTTKATMNTYRTKVFSPRSGTHKSTAAGCTRRFLRPWWFL